MRYHKAIEITKPEANSIIATADAFLCDTVVISHSDKWYDVRKMSCGELEAFVADLARAEIAAADAQTSLFN